MQTARIQAARAAQHDRMKRKAASQKRHLVPVLASRDYEVDDDLATGLNRNQNENAPSIGIHLVGNQEVNLNDPWHGKELTMSRRRPSTARFNSDGWKTGRSWTTEKASQNVSRARPMSAKVSSSRPASAVRLRRTLEVTNASQPEVHESDEAESPQKMEGILGNKVELQDPDDLDVTKALQVPHLNINASCGIPGSHTTISTKEHERMLAEKEITVVHFAQQLMVNDSEKFEKKMAALKMQYDKKAQEMVSMYSNKIRSKQKSIAKVKQGISRRNQVTSDIDLLKAAVAEIQEDALSRDLEMKENRVQELEEDLKLVKEQLRLVNKQRENIVFMSSETKRLQLELTELQQQEKALESVFYERDEVEQRMKRGADFVRRRLQRYRNSLAYFLETESLESLKQKAYYHPQDAETLHEEEKARDHSPELVLLPGEEKNVEWRNEMSKPVQKLMNLLTVALDSYYWVQDSMKCRFCNLRPESFYVSRSKKGAGGCLNCVKAQETNLNGYFEDNSYHSICTRLDMNVEFETAVDAIMAILREDYEYIMNRPIHEIKTRFSIYSSLLEWNPGRAGNNRKASPRRLEKAREAANRIGRIWKEKARRARESISEKKIEDT